jgi:hypothetical protein
VFTHRPALTRQPFSGIVRQNLPSGARLPISLLVPRSSASVCSVSSVAKRPSSAAGCQLSAISLSRPSDAVRAPRMALRELPTIRTFLRSAALVGSGSLLDVLTFRRSDVPTIRTFPFFSFTYELFVPLAKLKCFIFSKIRTLCTKHGGWASPKASNVRTFQRFNVLTRLESVLLNFSPPKSFRMRSYAKAPGGVPLLADNSRVFRAIRDHQIVTCRPTPPPPLVTS